MKIRVSYFPTFMSKEICAEELTGIDLSVFSKYGRGCLLLLVLYSWYLVTSGSIKYFTSTTTGTLIEKKAGSASTFEVPPQCWSLWEEAMDYPRPDRTGLVKVPRSIIKPMEIKGN